MADLPTNGTTDEPPFTNCSVDIFGSFLIKEGRKQLTEKWGNQIVGNFNYKVYNQL